MNRKRIGAGRAGSALTAQGFGVLGRLFHGAPVVLLVMAGMVPAAMAFTLKTPTAGSELVAGTEVDVRVEPGPEGGVSEVRYFWFRQNEEPVDTHLADPALLATSSAIPPFGGKLPVPTEALGQMRLLAVGHVARGRLGGHDEFDEVVVTVTVRDDLTGIDFDVQKPWRLDTLGRILELPVVGQYGDGVVRRLGGVSTGTSYRSSDAAVVAVEQDGMLRVVGNGRAVVTVTNAGREGQLEVVVRAEEDAANHAPVARTGPALTVLGGSKVALNGLTSSDPDGDPIKYEWSQVRGLKVPLLDPNTAQATFMAPKVSSKRLLRFALKVTDMKGPDSVRGADSKPAFLDVWILP